MDKNHILDAPWMLLENIDEMVYVTNIENDELIYMNAYLREALGFESHEAYQGRKCYKVLQGFDNKCSFCTNDKLCSDCFYSWTYKNPIMDKRFLLKDTMILWQGMKCRMELAVDIDSDVTKNTQIYSARAESILNECLKRLAEETRADEAIDNLLSYIGETLLCERTYIFEMSHDQMTASNTYEWCAEGVTSQKDALQNEPVISVEWWLDAFKRDELVRIDNLEDLRYTEPLTYAILKPQDINSLLVGPIYDEKGNLLGFLGADNPDSSMIALIGPLLKTIAYFVATYFERRNLLNRLEMLSYRDALTDCLNRNALSEYYSAPMPYSSLGLLYCDISGLKRVNDTIGHEAGDQLILNSCERIRKSVPEATLYRIGGDEFLGLCPDMDEEDFEEKLRQLREDVAGETFHVAVGGVWSEQQPIQLQSLMALADQDMYADKKRYYQINAHLKQRISSDNDENVMKQRHESPLSTFIKENNCDIESIIRSIELSRKKEYIFIGNMRNHQYYISDIMKNTFGFSSNYISELATQWVSRISTSEDVKLYQESMSHTLDQKKEVQELKYRVRTKYGQIFWVKTYTIFKWDDKGQLEFVCGVISKQDEIYMQDSTTGFRSVGEAELMLQSLDEPTELIVIGLNSYDKINEKLGRCRANTLLQRIGNNLYETFSTQFRFYRLDGVHFLVVPKKNTNYLADDVIQTMGEIIGQIYLEFEIYLRNPIAFGTMKYPNGIDTPTSLIEEANNITITAKKNPEQKFHVYVPSLKEKSDYTNKLEKQVHNAVRQGMRGFSVAFSPIFSFDKSKLKGGRLMVRWENQGVIYEEDKLLPFFENSNMMVTISNWALEESIKCCRKIITQSPDFKIMMCGVGAAREPKTFFYMAESFLNKYNVSGEHIVIELKQSHFRDNPQRLNWFADECKRLGIQLSLTQFSPEFTAWGALINHPAKILVPHKSIWNNKENGESLSALMKSLVYMCHEVDKLVLLQGVETKREKQMSDIIGADLVQGSYYQSLMDCQQMIKYINSYNNISGDTSC